MYSISAHGRMIADTVRMAAYARAIEQVVRPGAVVLDIGTGTGVLAILACRAGARRVYAVEPDDVIVVAREIAASNGCRGRIEFIQGVSNDVELPEYADVIVSDLRGILPLFRSHLASIIDARHRLLAPGGQLIPHRDIVWAAVVEAHEIYNQQVGPWNGNNLGLRLEAGQRMVTNLWIKARVSSQKLLTEPQVWTALEYTSVEARHIHAELTWTVSRAGTGHGVVAWFDSVLTEGVEFSNAPGASELLYGQAFFPWTSTVDLALGDTVRVSLHADPVGEEYIWRWQTQVYARDQPDVPKVSFAQSTFRGLPQSPATLRKRASTYIPNITREGEIDRIILGQLDGCTSLGEIARRVAEAFPDRFAHRNAALTRVAQLSQTYSS